MSNRQPSNNQSLHIAAPSISLYIGLQNCLSSISSDKPLKQSRNDILAFVQRMGPEGQKLAITTLMQYVEQPQAQDKVVTSYRWSVLGELLREYSPQDSFFSYFPQILYKQCSNRDKLNQYISNIYQNLKLPLNIQISIALSLYLSDRGELASVGETELVSKIKQYTSSEKQVKLPEKILDELLFQINISPQLNNKLDNETKILLETAQKVYKSSETRIYNYYRNQWQFFSNEAPIIQKPQPIALRKSDVFRDLGPSITQQIDTLKAVVSQIGILNEQDIFQCLMMMAQEKSKFDSNLDRFVIDLMYLSNNSKKSTKGEDSRKIFNFESNSKRGQVSWNVDNFLQYITQNIQNIKWQNVLACLDKQNLVFASDEHFAEIMKHFQKIRKLIKKWTANDSIFLKKWVHPESQAQFLIRLFSCKDPECLFFNQTQPKKGQNVTKENQTISLREIWTYQQLVTLLFEVSDFDREKVKQILQTAILKYPDALIKTLSEICPNKGQSLVNETFLKILPQYLQYNQKSVNLIQTLWNTSKQQLIESINELQRNDRAKRSEQLDLQKLVQIFNEIQGSLNQLVLKSDYILSIPLALIGAKRQTLNLEKWIVYKIEENQALFCKEMIHYLENSLMKQLRKSTENDQKQNILQQSQLTIETLNKVFAVILQKLRKDFPQSKYHEMFKKIQKQCCKLLPEVAEGQIYEQAERECEQEIKKIYKQEITIKEAVENLKRLKNSNKKQEMEHFANRITFLCIQLTYHHSYPQKQLMITADLFSALINANLMEKKIYQTFLHVIDEYLKEENQQFSFAMKVMGSIKEKLAHQSWFCQKLIDNQLVMRKDPEMVQSIIKSIEPPKALTIEKQRKLKQAIRIKNTPEQQSLRMIIQPQVPHQAQQHHHKPLPPVEFDILATLDKSKKIDLPDRESKTRIINTICNTLSLANVQEKAKQLKKTLDSEKALKLLAYRVLKNISITQNNAFDVFAKLLDHFPKAEKPIISITYKILIHWFSLVGKSANNDKKVGHFKNIGAWLGKMTIGKGLPVPIYKLNIRQILTNSYLQNNRLAYNIPVILRILQPMTTQPQIFRIESPWIRRIICTLHEIQSNLKQQQQIKNQIKAFFKTTKLQHQLDAIVGASTLLHAEDKDISINEEVEKLLVSEDLIKSCEGVGIAGRAAILAFLYSSIVEILDPVVERTVKISKTTTKQMINKDFAMEISCEKVRQSSINLIKQLAAPLAQVTCRQPLKAAIAKKVRETTKQHQEGSKMKQEQIENLSQKILNEILDAGCAIIKLKVAKAAQKSIRQDIQFNQGLELRNYLKKTGSSFTNQAYLSTIPAIVPHELRPSANGLTEQQYSIYKQLKGNQLKPIVSYQSNQNYPQLIDQLVQHQPLQEFKKQISQQKLTEEFLHKLHTLLLDDNNDESDMQYYMEICKEVKQYGGQAVCWRLFKDVADLKNNEVHVKILRKLVREKYFQETVLDQILQEEQSCIQWFQKWTLVSEQSVKQFVTKLDVELTKLQIKKQSFFYFCLKNLVKRLSEQTTQLNQSFNVNYCDQLILLAFSLANQSSSPASSLEPFIQSVILSAGKLCEKNSQSQRLFFKMLTSLSELVCDEKNNLSKQNKATYICILAKNLNKINPLQCPSFSFAWLELICNKNIIFYLLENYEYWDLYAALLASLLKFLNQNVNEAKLENLDYGVVYQKFYLAVLKLIIVLIHDYSSFLSAFSLQLCLLVEGRFIQLKNIINSAYPAKQLDIPLKFDKREDLQMFVSKVGYPKYYKLHFNKAKLNSYLLGDQNDSNLRQKLSQQQDLSLQTLILYFAWLSQHNLTANESVARLTNLLIHCKDELRNKILNLIINLIRYPNHITLFFIDFVSHIIFKQNKDKELKQLMLSNIVTRMKGEVPIAWGLIYLVNFVLVKKELQAVGLILMVENT